MGNKSFSKIINSFIFIFFSFLFQQTISSLKEFDLIFEDLYSTKLETFLVMSLIIQQLTYKEGDEVSLIYRSSITECSRILKLKSLNFITTSHGIVFAVNLNLDPEFYNFSTLLMGPKAGLRIFEQYKLSNDGSELFSNFTITNRQVCYYYYVIIILLLFLIKIITIIIIRLEILQLKKNIVVVDFHFHYIIHFH